MKIKTGDKVSVKKQLTNEIVEEYGRISGDLNPVHFSDENAVEYGFKGRIAHGLFCLGIISNLIGNVLPGPGSVFLDEELKYLAPVYLGDVIEVTVEIGSIKDNGVINILFFCKNQNDVEVLKGSTKVLYRSVLCKDKTIEKGKI